MQFAEHVQVRPEKFGAVVFETLSEKVFVANKTGAEILLLLQQGKTLSEIVAHLFQEYDSPYEIIKKDVENFITSLTNHGLLK